MRLRDVLSGCDYEIAGRNSTLILPLAGGTDGEVPDIEISGIAYDSRKVVSNGMFVAIRGENVDGHDFIDDAVKKGAVAVVGEKPECSAAPFFFVRVDDGRKALACIANNFYERPSENVSVIGITGTNGKTTTSYLIKSLLEAWGKRVGLIGTIAYSIGDRRYPAFHTTPESVEFQGLLREMAAAGCSHVVAEISSHSLSQKRVDYTRFVTVVFTNLTRDHLDFHETMENYYAAKERLFTDLLSQGGTAVINVDDEWGRRLWETLKARRAAGTQANERPRIITYGTGKDADVCASATNDTPSGISFTLLFGSKEYRVESPLVGIPNVYNILAAIAAGIALDVPMHAIQKGIRNTGSVKGRLEKVDAGQDFLCFIDYAHTPDALERLILTARTIMKNSDRPGRVITLFGCGGDRDRGKRGIMGEIASRLSDYVIVTSDNPRSEDPLTIVQEVESGMTRRNSMTVPDRREAITKAVERAETGDILLIAGKGHEEYQEIRGVRHSFSDREVVEAAIRERACREAGKR